MFLGIKGVTFSLSAACATSAVSIGEGAEVIRRGDANVVLVGGSEAGIMPIAVGGLNAMRAISTRNDAPQAASRPFDMTRDGFVPSEGAAVLVLESLEHAQARGAKILAELIGYSATCDATHVTAPDSDGAAVGQAMRRALAKAGLTANDIDYINAHGTSTKLNDAMETKAIKQVFGEQAYNIPISSTKSMTGHAMSASGALEAIFCVMAMNEGIMPPTINLEHPDPECDLDYIPHTARKKELRYVMSNSFGFGGQNAVLVLKRWENGAK
jgi:3-oxoacyl-(acyl-carrier-protein) synthase